MSQAWEDEARVAAELVARIGAGEAAAEEALVGRYRRGLVLLLRQLCRDEFQAEDLAQETLRIGLEKARAGAILEPGRFAGFLRTTARYLVANEQRRRARRREQGLPEPEEGSGEHLRHEPRAADPGPLAEALEREDRRRMRELLAALPTARDREALYLYHVAEEDRATIGRKLGLSSLQLNQVLFRARRRFRALVERDERTARRKDEP